MILTVCPNPCIDCTMELDALNVGKLNRIHGKTKSYSGKGLNVAIGIGKLGGGAYATGFMFNENGRMFEEYLDKQGVPATFVWCRGSVRVNYKFIDKKSMMTEINDRGEEVPHEKQGDLLRLVSELAKKADLAVMSGSLPKGVGEDYYGKLASVLPGGVRIAADSDPENLKALLPRGLSLIKQNLAQIESFSGRTLSDKRDIADACGGYLDAGAACVLVSLGSGGAIVTDGKKRLFSRSNNVAVNAKTGAGDAMMAAASLAAERGADPEEILRAGVAAGTASVATPGTGLFERPKYEEIYNALKVESF